MSMDAEAVRKALRALAEQLRDSGSTAFELVVCGGSALEALGLVDRTTRDVDVLALAERNREGTLMFRTADPLPEELISLSRVVARDLNLPVDWLNAGPTDLLSQGLPAGFPERLVAERFGPHLAVHFIGRFDQVCFKLYAVVNGGAERHLQDLHTLHPTPDEMLEAARWCLTQDASGVFPGLLKRCLKEIGYAQTTDTL